MVDDLVELVKHTNRFWVLLARFEVLHGGFFLDLPQELRNVTRDGTSELGDSPRANRPAMAVTPLGAS